MKKQLLTLIFMTLIGFVSRGQGLETFANYVGTSGTYSDGTFVGQDGSTWTYTQCRSDRAITAPSPCLGKARTPAANVFSGTIHNGCGTISFDYKQGFSTAVKLNLLINGLLVSTVTSPGGTADTMNVHNSGSVTVDIPGDFVIKFEQFDNATSGQVTVDNVSWTAYSSTPLPEPTNYPTAFTATALPYTIHLNWTDAVGGQLPTAYLVLASNQNNIVAPVDGTPVPDNANLSGGTGALNLFQGVQTCTFNNLPSNTQYFFKIFPYTNSGANINYKTDGTPPNVTKTTPNTVTLNAQNFTSYSLAPWIEYNVTGPQIWVVDSIHGVGATPCAKMSGYSGSNIENEDWLISPPMNFNNYINESMSFQSAYKYAGPALDLMISNDYDGSSDPTLFNWTPLTATWSPGNWVWTPSGTVDLSQTTGSSVYIGYRYMSTTSAASTWEVDDILITGDMPVGISTPDETRTIQVYPNPASDKVTITFGDNLQKEVMVRSVIGSLIYSTSTSSNSITINLANFAQGIYFIRTHYNNSDKTFVAKLVVR